MVTPDPSHGQGRRDGAARAATKGARRRRQGPARVRLGGGGHLPKLDAKLIEKALPAARPRSAPTKSRVCWARASSRRSIAACASPGKGTGAKVACKAIKKSKVERARGGSILKAKRNIGRVNLEVEAMNRLRHEGVCRLYEVVQSSSHVYCFIEAGERDLFSFSRWPSPRVPRAGRRRHC